MTRQEFLTELREALQGNVSSGVINENLDYYENYILQEVRKGKSEEEVVAALGNPRILAQTIIDTSSGVYEEVHYESERNYDDKERDSYGRVYTGTKAKVILAATIIAIILVIVGVIALVAGVISVIAPFIIPLILITLAIRILGRR